MIRGIIISAMTILSVIGTKKVWGQDSLSTEILHNSRKIEFDVNAIVTSNVVTNSFINTYAFDSFISDERKDDVSSRLTKKNRVGIDVSSYLRYTKAPEKVGDWGYSFAIGARNMSYFSFSKDLFELYFRGNKMFAGQTITVGDLNYLSVTYQDLQSVFTKKVSKKLSLIGGVSVLKGNYLEHLTIDRGTLYTAENGEVIEFDASLHMRYSDPEQAGFTDMPGIGTSIQLGAEYNLNNETTIGFAIKDIGFIRWNNINQYEADSSWYFEGAEVDNLLQFESSQFDDVRTDTITELLGIKKGTRKLTTVLPSSVQFYYQTELNKLALKAQLNYIFFKGYLPQLITQGSYKLSEQVNVLGGLYIGGFGLLDYMIGVEANFGHICGRVELFELENTFNQNNSSGRGLRAKIGYSF